MPGYALINGANQFPLSAIIIDLALCDACNTISIIVLARIINNFIPCEACSEICVKASALVSIYEARLIDITIGKAVEVPYEACTIGSIGNTP